MARTAWARRQPESSERERRPAAVRTEDIALLAYELFEQRGRAHGDDQQDWFEAERIIRGKNR